MQNIAYVLCVGAGEARKLSLCSLLLPSLLISGLGTSLSLPSSSLITDKLIFVSSCDSISKSTRRLSSLLVNFLVPTFSFHSAPRLDDCV